MKITIVTPSYNQAEFLEQTILSVLNQNYEQLEYIVIDGGSTDGSIDVIRKYEGQLDYWVTEKDRGQSHAINKGLRRATGDIVTWLNSDDLFTPGTLNAVAEYFSRSDAALIHGDTILFDGKGREQKKGAELTNLKVRYLAGIPFPQPSSFFRRTVLQEFGFLDESLHFGMDYDLFVRIALNGKVLAVPKVLSKYRLHADSKSMAQSCEFADDWARVFSQVLRSFEKTGELIEAMRSLRLYVEGDNRYPVANSYTQDELRLSFLYFLQSHISYDYVGLDVKTAGRLAAFIREFDPRFYATHQDLGKVLWRSKYLGRPVVKYLRQLRG